MKKVSTEELREMEVEDVLHSRRDPKFLWIRKMLEVWNMPQMMKTLLKDPLYDYCARDPYKRYPLRGLFNLYLALISSLYWPLCCVCVLKTVKHHQKEGMERVHIA